jgi:hypothetical protein
MFELSEIVIPIMASMLLSFVIFQTTLKLKKNMPFLVFYSIFFIVSMLLISSQYNEIEKYSNKDKSMSTYFMAAGVVLFFVFTLKSFIEKRIHWQFIGVTAIIVLFGVLSGQFFSVGKSGDKVTLAEAKTFMQRHCDDVSQNLSTIQTKDFNGRKQYYFLSVTRDFSGQACISIISEDALEIMSTSCGPADVKLEEWNNMF